MKSLGLLHLKPIEICPLTSVGTELGPKTTTTQPQRGWFTQTLLIKTNNKFPKVAGRRAYKYLNASPCVTSTFMLCCLHLVLFMVSWEKERLSTPRKSLSDEGCFKRRTLRDQWLGCHIGESSREIWRKRCGVRDWGERGPCVSQSRSASFYFEN